MFSTTNIFHLTRKHLEVEVPRARLAPEIWALSHIVEKWGARLGQMPLQHVPSCWEVSVPLNPSTVPLWFHCVLPRKGDLMSLWQVRKGETGDIQRPQSKESGTICSDFLCPSPSFALLPLHPSASFKCDWISAAYQALCWALGVQWGAETKAAPSQLECSVSRNHKLYM